MAQIDDFFMYENRVEGITDADYQRVQPYVEAAQPPTRASTSLTTSARISSMCRTIRSSSADILPTRCVRWAMASTPYPQIINAQNIPATLYGIDALPHTILFAPDGTIIARNIYGEELKEKLKELFNDNK